MFSRFVAGAALWRCPALWTYRVACFLRIALSGLRQVVTTRKFRGAGHIVKVSFGEDPSCVECHFEWQGRYLEHFVIAIAAFRNATAARGAILPSSFVPF